MDLSQLTPTQWIVGGLAALVTGMAKTGLPGAGILVVPVMAFLFPGKLSVGTLLPMLITADLFAVAFYRRHAQWDRLLRLVPWVALGLVAGLGFLLLTGGERPRGGVDAFQLLIGILVLAMLGFHLLRQRLGDRFTPRSGLGIACAGMGTGFTTCIANAAGPIMTVYLAGMRMPKEQFMGTVAWFFLLVNVAKVPLFIVVSLVDPGRPMITRGSLLYDGCMVPAIILGALAGAWIFKRVPQRIFHTAVLFLAAAAAIHLVVDTFLPR